ncbi:hypothetical protein L211DRAFT_847995 [Terfezia boudieri ATCC MYA-4762]|uniref:Uncharacterized protein n=1 Tax=Terfezia boudieri ATCC MYA-4762 TaxID=1051890 RepID=A0A3N4LWV7_9PEZI|nr:hypothetical protein L211DRAFT_847995 [Terfezia boudieri ATCC MYA-4762]
MSGSSSDRSSSSSSLTGYLDQFIRGAGEGRRLRRREKIRWRNRRSIPKGQDVGETDVTEGQWGLEHTDQPTGLDRSPGNDQDGHRALSSVAAHETVPLLPLIYGAPRYSSSQHRLVRRAPGSDNDPLIIGATLGGLCFVGVLIIAILVWRRRLKAKERQFMEGNNGGRWGGQTLSVITSPTAVNTAGDKLVDLGTMYGSPASAYRAGASRSSSVNNRTKSTPTSPIDKIHIRNHSWTQAGSIPGSPTAPAIAGVQIGNRIPCRATTQQSVVSSPSSIGKRPKRSSSVLQRFGHSRELSSPGSITTSVQSLSTNRGPPPPRPPRPDEENGAEEPPQIFELSASSSVRVKRDSKALPALPTFLVREHEEEMKRRKEEWEWERERERRDQYESQRRPQSFVDDSRTFTHQQSGESSAFRRGSGEMGMLANQEELALKKVMSLESLASTTTSSSSDCGDEDEAPEGSRRPIPEVNALSPRSSQRRPARLESGSRPPIPSFANTESESIATGDSLMKRTSYLIADGSSGVEATAVARGFPSPKLGEQLRLTPPLPSSASTGSSNISSVFGLITAPVSATVPKPLILPPPDQSRDGSLGAHIRAESTSSGGIAAPGEDQVTRGTFMLAGDSSERGLAFSSIEDWRESVGETYAGTRPTTAGAASTGPASAEDVPVPPVVIESSARGLAQPRPVFPRRISVDTGVGGMNMYPPPPVTTAGGALLTPRTAASTTAQSLFTPIEMVPVSAVTPPSGGQLKGRGPETLLLRPSTSERERELKKEVEGTSNAPRPALKADERAHSWLNVGEDSDSDS